MLNDAQLDTALNASPAERVTKEYMQSRITETKFHKLGPTLTHCTLHLDNGFSVTGESACVKPENYNQEIGERIARDNAFNKLWPLFGFLLAERVHLSAKQEVGLCTKTLKTASVFVQDVKDVKDVKNG